MFGGAIEFGQEVPELLRRLTVSAERGTCDADFSRRTWSERVGASHAPATNLLSMWSLRSRSKA